MGDNDELNLYDDLDVFGKEQNQCTECLELRDQLKELQEVLHRLKEENASFRKENETLQRNGSSLLVTARCEVQRKDDQIVELRKEKDNICFRRKIKLQGNVPTQSSATQSQISCKPNAMYELRRILDEPHEKPTERNQRRDENHVRNPFSKVAEHVEIKNNQKIGHAEKNGDHRHLSRNAVDYNNSRGKHNNQRNRDDERREQSNAVRLKRRRSRSKSNDRKKPRRSRSRSRRRDRNVPERHSPDKLSQIQLREKSRNRDQLKVQSPSRSSNKHDSDVKLHIKQKNDESKPTRHSRRIKTEPIKEENSERVDEKLKNIDTQLKHIRGRIKVETEIIESIVKREKKDDELSVLIEEKAKIESELSNVIEEKQADNEKTYKVESLEESKAGILETYHNSLGEPDIEMEDSENIKVEISKQEKMDSDDIPHVNGENALEEGEIDDNCDDANKSEIKRESQQPEISTKSPQDVIKTECVPQNTFTAPIKTELEQNLLKPAAEELTTIEKNNNSDVFVQVHDDTKRELNLIVEKNDHESPEDSIVQTDLIDIPKNIVDDKLQTKSHANDDKSHPKIGGNTETTENKKDIEKPQTSDAIVNTEEIKLEKTLPQINDAVNMNVKMENDHITSGKTSPSALLENGSSLTEDKHNKSLTETAETPSFDGMPNNALNTSGNKSVKNISTSSKDYLIVEDENNDTIIYVTRKKKKKKKSLEKA